MILLPPGVEDLTRRRALAATTPVLALIGATVATAYALRIRAGDIVIDADGGFSPKALPKAENAPITLHGGGKISTVSGALPPILKTVMGAWRKMGPGTG